MRNTFDRAGSARGSFARCVARGGVHLESGGDQVGGDGGSCAAGDSTTRVRQAISEAYGWRGMGEILLLFFGPVLSLIPIGAIWLMVDRPGLERMIAADNIADVLVAVVGLVAVLLVLKYISARNGHHGLTWADFGFRKVPVGRSVRYVTGFFGLVILSVVAITVAAILLGAPESPATPHVSRTALDWMFVLVGGVVIGPIGEEIVFRGALFGFLRERHRFAAAALLSSIVFMFTHVNPVVFVTAFPLGMFLCFMYKRLGSILPGIVLHMIWNLMVTMVT